MCLPSLPLVLLLLLPLLPLLLLLPLPLLLHLRPLLIERLRLPRLPRLLLLLRQLLQLQRLQARVVVPLQPQCLYRVSAQCLYRVSAAGGRCRMIQLLGLRREPSLKRGAVAGARDRRGEHEGHGEPHPRRARACLPPPRGAQAGRIPNPEERWVI